MATTNVTLHRNLPSALASAVETILTTGAAALAIADSKAYKVKHYAGEFLAEDNMERLKADLRQFNHILYDMELIEEIESDSTQRMPQDIFSFLIFCATSNFFDESIMWKSSYALAWDVRRMFQGVEIVSTPDIHGSGIFVPQSIERELHVPGLSVHTLRIDVELTHDVDGVI